MYKVFWVLCRNLTRPAISAGFVFIAKWDPAVVIAVEMWEPALYAGFQAPGKDREVPFWERPRVSGASFP